MLSSLNRHVCMTTRCVMHLYSTTTSKTATTDKVDITTVDEKPLFQDTRYSDEEIEQMRYKSKLDTSERNILFNKIPHEEEKAWFHKTVKYKKRMISRYGLNSQNVKGGICWPSKEEIEDLKEYERVAYPLSLDEAWKTIAKNRANEKAAILARDKEVAKNMEKMEQWKKELAMKILKKEAAVLAAKKRKDRVIEEIREHFGFKIDIKDERFKQMLEQKEKEDKKLRKQAKKDEQLKKYLSKLTPLEQNNRINMEVSVKPKREATEGSDKSDEKA